MPQTFVFPRQVALDDDANPLSGALLYFFQTGTTSPQAVYSDAALATPITQPVVADSAGKFQKIYLNPGAGANYRVRVTTSDGALIYQEDDIDRFTVTTAEIGQAIYPRTSAEISAGVTPVNYGYQTLHVFRYMSTAQIADVLDRTALVDVRAAVQTAINVAQQIGGTVYCPAGSYLIRRVAGGDSQFNGLHIPYTHVFEYDEHMVLQGDGRATVFLAGDSNMAVIRLSDSRTKLVDFSVDANGKTGVACLALISSNTSDTTLAEHIDWNIVSGLDLIGGTEGLEMQSPSAGGCYYNRFERIRFYNNTRHVRMRDNAQSGGTNRNLFVGCSFAGGNTGIDIDGADTNCFVNCTFENISVGTSPYASPVAVRINLQGSARGLLSQDTNFIGCMWEACTVDINTDNRRVSIIGGNCGASNPSTKIVSPNGIDMLVGGDTQYLVRNLLLGSANVTGLVLQPSAIAYTTHSQIGTSSNQAGAYPFNGDGHLIIQGRQSDTHDITVRTGSASTERIRIGGGGHINILSGDIALGMDDGGAIANASTIATAGVRTVRVNPAASVTGIILQAGTQPGQMLTVINESSANTVTFAGFGTSRVADGTAAVIAVNRCMSFIWNHSASGWYRT